MSILDLRFKEEAICNELRSHYGYKYEHIDSIKRQYYKGEAGPICVWYYPGKVSYIPFKFKGIRVSRFAYS